MPCVFFWLNKSMMKSVVAMISTNQLKTRLQAKYEVIENMPRLIAMLHKFRTDCDKLPAEPYWPHNSLNSANHYFSQKSAGLLK